MEWADSVGGSEIERSRKERYGGLAALLVAACVWGGAFVPQRMIAETMGANTCNAIRYLLAGLVMLPFVAKSTPREDFVASWNRSFVLGSILFIASVLQQSGMAYTTAGKAGFITGLYMVVTPLLLAIFWQAKLSVLYWLGAVGAVCGLGLLCLDGKTGNLWGDLLVLACAVGFACHLIFAARYVKVTKPLALAMGQYFVCGLLSAFFAVLFESLEGSVTIALIEPLLYMALVSTVVGYTLALVGQRYVEPQVAAIVLSLEAVFAVVAGQFFLLEQMSVQQGVGCILMFIGCIVAERAGQASR